MFKVKNWKCHLDKVHEDKLAEDCSDSQQSQAVANIQHSVLQTELSRLTLNIYDELQPVRLENI